MNRIAQRLQKEIWYDENHHYFARIRQVALGPEGVAVNGSGRDYRDEILTIEVRDLGRDQETIEVFTVPQRQLLASSHWKKLFFKPGKWQAHVDRLYAELKEEPDNEDEYLLDLLFDEGDM